MKKTLFISAALLITTPALADTVVKFTTGEEEGPNTLYIKEGKVLIPSPDAQGRMVMDTSTEKMIIINDGEKQVMEVNDQSMNQMAGVMNQMRDMMKAQLQNMPPEQRKMMEQRFGISSTEEAASEPEVKITATGKSKEVSGIKCAIQEISTDGQKTAEACVATQKDSGMEKADYDTLQKMFTLSKKFTEKSKEMTGGQDLPAQLLPKVNGVPVEVKDLTQNKTVTITAITTEKLDSNKFTPGADYKMFNPFDQMQNMMGR